ncbi:MAG: hypothetical protein HYX78_04025 [Armatimonadetes bacterium]|nr:hypothetical protein [Armatimonadota bacterium]
MRLTVFIIAISMLFCSAFAEEDKPDVRLDQKVTYQAKGQPLYRVLDELTEKVKVNLDCGKNSNDWQVRDRKVTIFVKDMPLKDLQKALAELLHFTWARGTDDEENYTYRLFQDLKQRKEEERLREQDAQAEVKREMERRRTAIREIEKLESLSPEEIEKLKSDSPYLYILAKEPIGKALVQMLRSMPDLRAALIEGREATISLGGAPPQTLEAARGVVRGFDSMRQRIDPSSHSRDGLADNIADARIRVNHRIAEAHSTTAEHRAILGTVEINASGGQSIDLPFMDQNSPVTNAFGKAMIGMLDGMPKESVGPQMEQEMKSAILDQLQAENPVEPLPDDPELEEKVKLDLKPVVEQPDVLEEIAKKSSLQILSDHFVHKPLSVPNREDKLGSLLRMAASLYEKRITKTGSLVVFEDRKWFEKRAWEVQEDWLEHWRAAFSKGTLGFEDLVDIACLTDEQINNTIQLDRELRSVAATVRPNRHVLRFYATLSEGQQQSLISAEGLDSTLLTAEQWPHFDYLVSRLDEDKLRPDTQLAMSLTGSEQERRYTFHLNGHTSTSDGAQNDVLSSWDIALPSLPPPLPTEIDGKGKVASGQ